MNDSVFDELFAYLIGREGLKYFKNEEHLSRLIQNVELDALRTLDQIKLILNDETLNDPECFQKIEAIVEIFHKNGLSTFRHDWG